MTFDEWIATRGIVEAYRVSYSPTHLGGSDGHCVDVWTTGERWLFWHRRWVTWPSAKPEPDLVRGAPLSDRAAARVVAAFDRVRFFDAPESVWIPSLDGGVWTTSGARHGRVVHRSVSGSRWSRPTSPTDWDYEPACTAVLRTRPSLLRWPRSVAV